ncbi:MAG: chondroitinase-B domain-containing protein [Candidatus Marinimicrobia bacterium]|nr:chondroitinase-B domain-containing protein [Candidatus Neomarinimicrobiota bacterium]
MLLSAIFTVCNEDELQRITSLNAGDTLLIKEGYYSDVTMSFTGNGTELDSVYVMAEKPGSVIFNGLSTLSFSGNYLKIEGLFFVNGYARSGESVVEFRQNGIRANHSRLTQCAILNYNPSNKDIDYKWVSLYGKNNRVDHCHFEGKLHSGTTLVVWIPTDLDKPNYHQIDYNYFGPRPDLGYNGGETIRIGTSDYSLYDSRTRIEMNLFYQCDGEIEIISNKSCENVFRHNTFLECNGTLTLRHGNRCIVEGNFFFGNFLNNAGGIRIIGEDHLVVNNYLQDIYGSGYRSALCIVKGVENSPLNRYYQVKRAIIANNTIVHSKYPITIGYGSSEDQTLPPDSCVIVNNTVDAGMNNTVLYIGDSEGTPKNFIWDGNVFFGNNLGIPNPGGIIWIDPSLEEAFDGLFRPTLESPLIGSAVIEHVIPEMDMDGQVRTPPFDIGADEVSDEPIIYKPLTQEDVGPDWKVEIQYITEVEAGENTLSHAMVQITSGDTLKLVTPGGIYKITEALDIDHSIVLLSDFQGEERPIIYCSEDSMIFRLKKGGKLYLKNLILNGYSENGSMKSLVGTAKYTSGIQSVRFNANGCLFTVSGSTYESVSAIYLNRFIRADSLVITKSEFTNFTAPVFDLGNVEKNSGDYRANSVSVTRSTFWNNPGGVLTINAGDENPFTIGPRVIVDYCTFSSCGSNLSITLDLIDVDAAEVRNSIFYRCSPDTAVVTLYGWGYIEYSNLFNSGIISQIRGGNIHEGMLFIDPEFLDPEKGDFTLPGGNVLLSAGKNGEPLGDPRWTIHASSLENPVTELPATIILEPYPNPANASLMIYYEISGHVLPSLSIYSITGSLLKTINLSSEKGSLIVNLQDFPSGILLFCLSNGKSAVSKKVIVLK